MKEHIIWSNVNLNVEDWKDFLEEEYPDVTDENEKFRIVSEDNDENLYCERANLNIPCGTIIAIADIGRWNGRRSGYKLIESGNLKDILYSDMDYVKWYADRYNVRAEMHDHDGSTYVLYREIRDDVNIDNLLERLYSGKPVSSRMLRHYTKSIRPYVAKVYGW